MSPVSFVTVDGNQATAFETHPDWDQNEDEAAAAAAAGQEDQEHLNDGEEDDHEGGDYLQHPWRRNRPP